jgi:phosphate transport system substrate-binding protein
MRTRLIGAALFGALGLAACGGGSDSSSTSTPAGTPTPAAVKTGNPTTAVTLKESGSSLMFPYLQTVVAPLTSAYSNITLSPAAGGSGKGISDTIAGASDLGGSDAYLSPGQMAQNPGLANLPVAVSAQDVYVNVPGVTSLKLSGDVIAKIYMGQITKWNDAAIASLNSGTNLPSTGIVPVRRVDSSGDTFLFTSFLAATNSAWSNGPSIGTTVTWPSVSAEITANGNPGMVTSCQSTPGCIAYIGISAQASANSANLTLVKLQNKAGQFVNADDATIASAVNAVASQIPANLAQSLIYQDGAQSYPIVNYEYLVVNKSQTDANKSLAIRTFLVWMIDTNGGATPANLSKANFIALPTAVLNKVKAAIAAIAP